MKYADNLSPKQLKEAQDTLEKLPEIGKKTVSLIGWMIEQGEVAEHVDKRVAVLPPDATKGSSVLRDIVFSEYAFYMHSTHGIPPEMTYEWIKEKIGLK